MKLYIRRNNDNSDERNVVSASQKGKVQYVADADTFDFSTFDPNADYKFPDFKTYRKWVERLDAEVDY